MRSSSGPELVLIDDAQFAGDDLRKRRLAKARRAVEQNVIERLAAAARRLNGDLDVFLHARLADVIGEALRADARVDARVFIQRRAGDDASRRLAPFAARFLFRNSSDPSTSSAIVRRIAIDSGRLGFGLCSARLKRASLQCRRRRRYNAVLQRLIGGAALVCAGAVNCCSAPRRRSQMFRTRHPFPRARRPARRRAARSQD